MMVNRWDKLLLGLALVALFGLGVWFRASSLLTSPHPFADEASSGIQGAHLIQGKPVTVRTYSGNIYNPLLILLQLPLHALFEPSFEALRAPAVGCGVLAVVLAYVLGARVFDRPTALIAAGLLATLPIAIISSRIAWESCQVILFGVLLLYCAYRGNRLGLLLAFAASFLAHPTTVFLAPMLMAILLFQMGKGLAADPIRVRLRMAATTAVAVAVVGTLVYVKRGSASTQDIYSHWGFGNHDWPLFLRYYKKILLGLCQGVRSTDVSPLSGWLFRGVVGPVFLLGAWRLAEERRWDRLVLVGGLGATVTAFHEAVGANALRPELARYGLFMVVPTAFAFACLLRSLLVRPATPALAAVLRAEVVALLTLGFALLYGYKVNYYDQFTDASDRRSDSIWTLRSEMPDYWREITRFIDDDLRRLGPDRPNPAVVVADDVWSYRPVQYLEIQRPDVLVRGLERLKPEDKARLIRKQIQAGAYLVGIRDQEVEKVIRESFPPESLRKWSVIWFVLYRAKRPAELAAAGARGGTGVAGGATPAVLTR